MLVWLEKSESKLWRLVWVFVALSAARLAANKIDQLLQVRLSDDWTRLFAYYIFALCYMALWSFHWGRHYCSRIDSTVIVLVFG